MNNLGSPGRKVCASCRSTFIPKDGGYNALYCSDRCKRRSQRARIKRTNPDQLIAARKRTYARTKSHPDRIKKVRDAVRDYRSDIREWLASYKMRIGCQDCGYDRDPAPLQFRQKEGANYRLADARSSVERLKVEIESGLWLVICANCYSIRAASKNKPGASNKTGRGCD